MKKIVLVLCLMGVCWSFVYAQVTTTGLSKAEGLNNTVYGLGLSAGWMSGIGLSFRAHMPSNSSVQAVFGIIKTSDKLAMTFGGEYQYDLVRNRTTRFFVGGGIGYYFNGSAGNDVSGPFRFGAGIGGEFQVQEAFHITLEAMFVYFSDGRVLPLPGIAAHYYFF